MRKPSDQGWFWIIVVLAIAFIVVACVVRAWSETIVVKDGCMDIKWEPPDDTTNLSHYRLRLKYCPFLWRTFTIDNDVVEISFPYEKSMSLKVMIRSIGYDNSRSDWVKKNVRLVKVK